MRITLEQASQLLNAGDVVALPTETVYGLAASLQYPKAIDKIFALKGRPSKNPLIVHLSDAKELDLFALAKPPKTDKLIQAFWPGALTLVVPVHKENIPDQARAGLPTAAFRIPRHPLTTKLLKVCGPLVMPSANLSGRPSATRAEHVEADFGTDFPVLDGGPCRQGLESTILLYHQNHWEIGRMGAVDAAQIEAVLGYIPPFAQNISHEAPICPGQLYRHYAPRAQLNLAEVLPPNAQGIVLGFSERQYPAEVTLWTLGSLSDPKTVAESLYFILRKLDEEKVPMAWVDIDFPKGGLWDTIHERLSKAASK